MFHIAAPMQMPASSKPDLSSKVYPVRPSVRTIRNLLMARVLTLPMATSISGGLFHVSIRVF